MYIHTILKKNNTHNTAFTMIEFLIYFSILAILIFATSSIVFQVSLSKVKLGVVQDVSQNARYVFEQITNSIHNAQSISSPSIGQSAQSLSLVFADGAKNPTVFDLSSGILRIKEGSGVPVAMNADEVTISSLYFTNVSYPNTPGAVRIALTMSSLNINGQQSYTHSETFYTTVTIRPK